MTFGQIKTAAIAATVVLAVTVPAFAKKGNYVKPSKREPGLYSVFQTNKGLFVVRFFPEDAPVTVNNFVGLAEGTKEFIDPKTGNLTRRKFFDGLVFHRIIDGFMIQGGDPLGTGYGGPGFQFKNEDSARTFDRPGIIAMANAGRDTNGSQFFITVAPTSNLNGGYTIFGEVVQGYDVVEAISKVPVDGEKPKEPVVMQQVTIEEWGKNGEVERKIPTRAIK